MSEAELEARIQEAVVAAAVQGDTVRALKDEVKALKKSKVDTKNVDAKVAEAVAILKERKALVEQLEKEYEKVTGIPRNKEAFREVVNKAIDSRFFYKSSFAIYGGVSGFFDYGPPGTALKANITQFWRQHFVFQESMLEVECPAVTPEVVLKASGHVDRFEDFMVKDAVTGECIRADHLLEDVLERVIADPKAAPEAKKGAEHDLAVVGEMKCEDLRRKLAEYKATSPDGNAISDPYPFNLMFKTSIGPRGDLTGYLRPETAQGIFVNFRDLLYYNGGKLPFAAAQIGQSFRNEINPRQGLLRVRDFTQAEIEHFVHPDHKDHPRFSEVADVAPLMYSQALQLGDAKQPAVMKLGDAVRQGVVANETLAYFIGRTFLFMTTIGVNPKRMRFRQHLPQEMAHYAADCWDCEVDTSYGWIECAGLADRSAFDLTAHASASKTDLVAYEQFDEPKVVDVVEVVPEMKVLGKELKKAGKAVAEHLKGLVEQDALCLKERIESSGSAEVTVDGETHTITKDMLTIERVTKKLSGRNFVPSVIEPSFGIGRILYCVLEHTFHTRPDDEQKTLFRFSPIVAPVKTTVFPLMQKQELNEVATRVSLALRGAGLSNIIDTTGSTIGKRYARTDEVGVPFAVTVDFDTLNDDTVTVRERDSMSQVRVPIKDVPVVLKDLCELRITWKDMQSQYPAQQPAAEE